MISIVFLRIYISEKSQCDSIQLKPRYRFPKRRPHGMPLCLFILCVWVCVSLFHVLSRTCFIHYEPTRNYIINYKYTHTPVLHLMFSGVMNVQNADDTAHHQVRTTIGLLYQVLCDRQDLVMDMKGYEQLSRNSAVNPKFCTRCCP